VADARLRELERRWRETGAVQDEAAWLAERVRAGQLARGRLELAARLGHAGASTATGEEPATDLLTTFRSLEELGDRTDLVRAQVLLTRRALPVWDRSLADVHASDGRPRLALDAVEAWLERRDEPRLEAVRRASAALDDLPIWIDAWVRRRLLLPSEQCDALEQVAESVLLTVRSVASLHDDTLDPPTPRACAGVLRRWATFDDARTALAPVVARLLA
jgi:hypothetical protein